MYEQEFPGFWGHSIMHEQFIRRLHKKGMRYKILTGPRNNWLIAIFQGDELITMSFHEGSLQKAWERAERRFRIAMAARMLVDGKW